MLPPAPSLTRDLIITSMALIKQSADVIGEDVKLSVSGDSLIINIKGDWSQIVGTALKFSLNVINVKKGSGIRAPGIHINDWRYIFKEMGVRKGDTYIDAFESVLKNKNLVNKLSNLKIASAELKNLIPSKGGYPLPQIFKIELYERALTFHKIYTANYPIRISDVGLLLLAMGFSLAYAGFVDGKISFIALRDESLENNIKFSLAVELATSLINEPLDPVIPFLMYMSLTIPDMISIAPTTVTTKAAGNLQTQVISRIIDEFLLTPEEHRKFEDDVKSDYSLPYLNLNLHILSVGKAYTALLRTVLNYSPTLRFSYKIDELCEERGLGNRCRLELRNVIRWGLGGRIPKLVNVITLLYEAINKAKQPTLITYLLLRTINELKDLGIRLSRECVEVLIDALGM